MERTKMPFNETVGFDTVNAPTTKHVVTTGKYKGWTMNTSLVLKKAIFRGINVDGTPIIDVTYQIVSTPTPPEPEKRL